MFGVAPPAANHPPPSNPVNLPYQNQALTFGMNQTTQNSPAPQIHQPLTLNYQNYSNPQGMNFFGNNNAMNNQMAGGFSFTQTSSTSNSSPSGINLNMNTEIQFD